MVSFLNRLLRGTVLGLMLLLAATANLVSFSYDADDDDDTPPVNIELNIVTSTKKPAHLVKHHSSVPASRVENEGIAVEETASTALHSVLPIEKASPQLAIPLRT